MKNGRIQAKDIPDADMFAALKATRGMHGVPHWSSLWDVEKQLATIPPKVVRAKLGSMIGRGLIEGCDCGCRGDFQIPGADMDHPDG